MWSNNEGQCPILSFPFCSYHNYIFLASLSLIISLTQFSHRSHRPHTAMFHLSWTDGQWRGGYNLLRG